MSTARVAAELPPRERRAEEARNEINVRAKARNRRGRRRARRAKDGRGRGEGGRGRRSSRKGINVVAAGARGMVFRVAKRGGAVRERENDSVNKARQVAQVPANMIQVA